ncbi:hypothetical protein [Virgibacillus sp. SK37]|uniref:hypothetical protein n=1 Tax=Virgibacillus sp. SK37 TaxID=403957 RepID=UPI0004D19639|nr:hypothetical protein [Virgibacillus sp. SK37]AIF45374.1 hypothetical protein X953_08635 [Virgibacillus sp. SK37]
MNTEINFLEKQPWKYQKPAFFVVLFLLLLTIAVSILYIQKNRLGAELTEEKNKIVQLEEELLEINKTTVNQQQLNNIKEEVESIRMEELPVVASYYKSLEGLKNPDQLVSFEYTEENQLVMDAVFSTVEEAANYVEEVQSRKYILRTELTTMTKLDKNYQATVTITMDEGILREELGGHVEGMD